MLACRHRNNHAITSLVAIQDLPLNARDVFGATALMYLLRRRPDLVAADLELVLDAGADRDIPDITGTTPLMTHLQGTLGATRRSTTAEHLSLRSLDILVDATSYAEGIDLANNRGSTPLHMACEARHFDRVRVLLAARANATLRDGEGMTALDCAWADEDAEMYLVLSTVMYRMPPRKRMYGECSCVMAWCDDETTALIEDESGARA
ncbi:ankyrin [Gonapodya prolifera JEL478]|uniref:Ankyrin n=1 Tax=Gonapodya prolifera (strain JEL478) TaxID=1344416 RepID=A0A139AKA1_GONPJ|nr:ankyrin [Gonapodya prolifera JEL478]|eukprot:KXS17211.1 ankyrin [Gonapodya prolifera JEL478]